MKKIFYTLITYEFKRYGTNIMTPITMETRKSNSLGISKDGKISFTK
jgi:hypothetical protein